VPAPDGGDDFVGVLGPAEAFRVFVCLNEEAVDGRLQRGGAMRFDNLAPIERVVPAEQSAAC
jgi:hypothetical protein